MIPWGARRRVRRWPARGFPEALEGPGDTYARFIVLSSPRSGSSLLVQSLRAHPDVVSFGELFNRNRIGFNTEGFRNDDRRLRRLRDRDPAGFLSEFLLRGMREEIVAVGFKIFYAHLERRRFAPLASYLTGIPGLRVIHLVRDHMLRSYLSGVIASKTGVWGIRSEDERRPLRVRLKPAKCRAHFQRQEAARRRWAGAFGDAEVMGVQYEELAGEYDRTTLAVQRFLDAREVPVLPPIVRQEVRPLQEAIVNYAELRDHFSDTRWSRFFDE